MIYFEIYNEIIVIVKSICDVNDIGLVFCFDCSEIVFIDWGFVIKGVNCNIVFNCGYDLIDMVYDMVVCCYLL